MHNLNGFDWCDCCKCRGPSLLESVSQSKTSKSRDFSALCVYDKSWKNRLIKQKFLRNKKLKIATVKPVHINIHI